MQSNLNEKLAGMVGKSYLFNAIEHKIVNYRIDDDVVTVVTDKKFYDWSPADAEHKIRQFMPVSRDVERLQLSPVNGEMKKLKSVVMAQIDGLQNGTVDIKQAAAVNGSIKTLLNMAKLEIEAMKLLRKED